MKKQMKKQMKINKGSQEGFMSWLETFEDNELIGRAGDMSDCPLQHYLTSINPTLEVSVSGVIAFLKGRDIEFAEAEEWQWCVMRIADSLSGFITKKQFREKQMNINKGSQKGFMLWLEKFEDDRIIGYALNPRTCPLNNYLTYINPHVEVFTVEHMWFQDFNSIVSEILEPWQNVVMLIADRMHGAITKKQFLEVYQ
jgi:hypothetical protein